MIDVEQNLVALGIDYRGSGHEFTAPCPMHAQRTGREDFHPSWSINATTGLFICYSCGYRGSMYTLIADLTGVTLEQAKTTVVKPTLGQAMERVPKLDVKVKRPEVLPESTLGKYKSPPRWARNRRGLTSEACEAYGVLWNPVDDNWILPIRTPEGALIGWQEKGEMTRHFRNSPMRVRKSRCLFGYQIFTGGRMVVVESPLDPVRMLSNGVTGGVATYGSEVSAAQIHLMTAADEVVFALDNYTTDKAGKKSTLRMIEETRGVLAHVRVFNYTGIGAKDPGEMDLAEIEQGIRDARSRVLGERAIS